MPNRDNVTQRKGTRPVPPLGPGDAFGLNAQYQTLVGQRSDILGTLAAQRAEVRSAFANQRAAVRRAEALGVADVENAAIGRGVLGGSVDLKARLGVRANAATQLADALSARNQALLANQAARMQANRDFEMGTANLQAQKAAIQSTQVANDFLENLVTGTGGGFGGGGGGAGGADTPDISKPQKRKLRELGRDVEQAVLVWARASGSARTDFMDAVNDAWRRRNDVRRRFGLAPIPRARLRQYMQDISAQYDTPGGLI